VNWRGPGGYLQPILRAVFGLALGLATLLGDVARADDEALLRIDSGFLKWGKAAPGSGGTVLTYALLTTRFAALPGESRLSPDNCRAMHAFSDIVGRSPGVSVERAKLALEMAFRTWEEVADLKFVEADSLANANIVFGAEDESAGRAFTNLSYRTAAGGAPAAQALGQAGPGLSWTTVEGVKAGTVVAIERAFVCLNPVSRWKVGFDGNLDIYDLRYTFTHEIGHAVGLDHPGATGAVMAYRYDESVERLQTSDIAAVQRLYGRPKH